jgi:hypothetical protein
MWIKTFEEKLALQVLLAPVLYMSWVKFDLIFFENGVAVAQLVEALC